MGVKVGTDHKAYRNTSTYGTPTWNEITIVRDLTLSMSKTMAAATARLSGYVQKKGALKEVTVEFDILADAAIDDYDVLRDAFIAGTVLDVAIADGAIATVGTKYWRYDVEVAKFDRGEPLNDIATTAVTLEQAYSSNAPGFTTVS